MRLLSVSSLAIMLNLTVLTESPGWQWSERRRGVWTISFKCRRDANSLLIVIAVFSGKIATISSYRKFSNLSKMFLSGLEGDGGLDGLGGGDIGAGGVDVDIGGGCLSFVTSPAVASL